MIHCAWHRSPVDGDSFWAIAPSREQAWELVYAGHQAFLCGEPDMWHVPVQLPFLDRKGDFWRHTALWIDTNGAIVEAAGASCWRSGDKQLIWTRTGDGVFALIGEEWKP